jgi:hypothetical protein
MSAATPTMRRGSVLTPMNVIPRTGDQFDDDRNQFLLAPATQIDFRLAGRIDRGGHFSWHFVVENRPTRGLRLAARRS